MKLRHPKSGRIVEADRDRAEVYESQGWVVVAEVAKKPAGSKKK